jgi:hypothetical protein
MNELSARFPLAMDRPFTEERRRDCLHALERAIDGQEDFADRIDKANPGDRYASLMVREDIDLLQELHRVINEKKPYE